MNNILKLSIAISFIAANNLGTNKIVGDKVILFEIY